MVKKKIKDNNGYTVYMHSEHLANTSDSKHLSDQRLVFLKKTVATELLHYPVILHRHVFSAMLTRTWDPRLEVSKPRTWILAWRTKTRRRYDL